MRCTTGWGPVTCTPPPRPKIQPKNWGLTTTFTLTSKWSSSTGVRGTSLPKRSMTTPASAFSNRIRTRTGSPLNIPNTCLP